MMSRYPIMLVFVAVSLLGGVSSLPATEAEDAWPMFRANGLSQGVASKPLPPPLKLRWRFKVADGAFESTPTIVGELAFIADLDGSVFALNLKTGKPNWTFKSEIGFATAAAFREGRLYLGDLDGLLRCLDAKTGKELWNFRSEAEINSSVSFYKESVLFGSQDATLYCLDAKKGTLIWKHMIADQIRCMPTVVEDRAFVAGCDGFFHLVDVASGKEAGSVAIDSPTGATPAVLDDLVYFGTEGGVFFALDWKKKKTVWRFQDDRSGLPFRASAAVRKDQVVFAGHDKRVRSVDPKTGELKWEFVAKSRLEASPVLAGKTVWVGTSRGRLLALDSDHGKLQWEYECQGGLIGSPAVARGVLVVATDRGVVYCFEPRK